MLHHQLTRRAKGFSLLELVVAAAIIATVSAWAMPNFIRTLRQGDVDRYTQAIEAGLYDLRATLGTSRSSCQLTFNQTQTWVNPYQLLEFRQPNGTYQETDRLRCCNSQIHQAKLALGSSEECEDGPKIGSLLQNASSLRFIRLEGSPESKQVEVAVSTGDYELTPPGTSARTEPIIFMVRSLEAGNDNRLRTRCVEISGSGHLSRGTWEGSLSQGYCRSRGAETRPNP